MGPVTSSSRVADLPRRIASALVPNSGKRLIDRARTRYTLATITPANREFVSRYGLQVSGGPFRGMQYLPGQEEYQGDLVLKLLGIYEEELHGALAAWQADPPEIVVNVGCAEGYYAVGLALTMPQTRILAYDIDPAARLLCARFAELNGVADRVEIHGECTPAVLEELDAEQVAVLSDCEGYELTLLDGDAVPALRRWRILVECHDFVEPSITATLQRRFSSTHEVSLITSVAQRTAPVEMSFMNARQRAAVLNERPVTMTWLAMTPRNREAVAPAGATRRARPT